MKVVLASPEDKPTLRREGGKTYVSLPSRIDAEQVVHAANRKLADLPDVPEHTNPISAVIAYELFGLSTEDIAIAFAMTVHHIEAMRRTEAYGTIRAAIVANVTAASQDEVTAIFKSKATTAANKIVEHIDSAQGLISMRASKEVLTMSGYGPAQDNAQDRMSQGLNIIIYNDKTETPTVLESE